MTDTPTPPQPAALRRAADDLLAQARSGWAEWEALRRRGDHEGAADASTLAARREDEALALRHEADRLVAEAAERERWKRAGLEYAEREGRDTP